MFENFSKEDLKEYCLYKGLKTSGKRSTVENRIEEKEGEFGYLMKNKEDPNAISNFLQQFDQTHVPLNEVDKEMVSFVFILKMNRQGCSEQSISELLVEGKFNHVTHIKFGRIPRKTYAKLIGKKGKFSLKRSSSGKSRRYLGVVDDTPNIILTSTFGELEDFDFPKLLTGKWNSKIVQVKERRLNFDCIKDETKLILNVPLIKEYMIAVDKITFEYHWKRELLFFDMKYNYIRRQIFPRYEEDYRF